jgi:drug/metabolite transporter (DMT)-like permease
VLALVFVVAAGGARPAALGVVGVLVVSAGVLLVRGPRGDLYGLAVGATIAAIIAGYTVVDRYGIQHAAAGPYLLLIMVGPAIFYPIAIGRRRLRAAAGWRPVAVGTGLTVAYLLVLLALRLASAPAVSAVRETSVVIATALAAVFLHERVSRGRLAGSMLVAAGVAMLALS